jgi:Ligand-gated ion channel
MLHAFLCLPLLVLHFSYAQQKPAIFVPKFDTTKSYRTNVCERQRLIWNGSVAFPDALRGLNLTVVLTDYQYGNAEDEFFSLLDGKIRNPYPGLFGVMIDEVAARAGFEWRNSFGTYSPLDLKTDVNKTWTDILLWAIEVYDISVEVWGRSLSRMSSGISFPAGWYDSSATFAEHIDKSNQIKKVVNIWSFFAPFSYSVWIAILISIFLTGVTYWLLEFMDVDTGEVHIRTRLLQCVYHASLVFTGHFPFRPKSNVAKILSFSWTFWALIVISSYTANMANYLVSPKVKIFHINSAEEAMKINATVCVQSGAIVESVLKAKYPALKILGKQSESDIFDSLRKDPKDGGCQAAAHQMNSVRVYKRDKKVNYDCSLTSDEVSDVPIPAGMATIVDTGQYRCTSLISAVLDYHLRQMIDDGFVEDAWVNHMSRVGNMKCPDETQTSGVTWDETFALDLMDVGGSFIIHVLMSCLALAVAVISFISNPRKRKRTIQEVLGIQYVKDAIQN